MEKKKHLSPNAVKIILLAVLLPILVMIWPFVQRPHKQESVPAAVEPAGINDVNAYLEQNLFEPNFGGKLFCAHKSLGQGENEEYIWALCEEYYLENDEIKAGTGQSLPVVLEISEGKVVSHVVPGDGSLYGEDIRKLFPENLHDTIFGFSASSEMDTLSSEVRSKAQAHFIVAE